jgi:hypothetical protein
MITGGFLALAMSLATACAEPGASDRVPSPRADSTLAALHREGATFADFLAAAKNRKEQWQRNYETAQLPDALITRARAAGPGSFRLLVVAADGCSDSVNTIPYVARFAESVGIELRIIDTAKGQAVMEAHRTPDGRAATPTVVLLDEGDAEAGCFVERPQALVKVMTESKGKIPDGELFTRKMGWYDEDKGQETLREIVEILEAARSGSPRCGPGA